MFRETGVPEVGAGVVEHLERVTGKGGQEQVNCITLHCILLRGVLALEDHVGIQGQGPRNPDFLLEKVGMNISK